MSATIPAQVAGAYSVTPDQAAAYLAWSDTLDAALASGRLAEAAAGRRGRRAGYAAGYAAGYFRAIADLKATEHELVARVGGLGDLLARRWSVRGEVRTRAAFGAPHPADLGPALGAALGRAS